MIDYKSAFGSRLGNRFSLITLTAIGSAAIVLATYATAVAERHVPNIPGAANGRAAIAVLGPRLPEVARRHGFSPSQLEELLLNDQNLYVDINLGPDGGEGLFYVEPELGPEHGGEGDTSSPEESPPFDGYSPSQAFELNSKLGSNRTIYLDFDGHVVSDTAWNSSLGANFNASAFDLDGNPGSFNDTERNRIIEIWRRVAEDFAGFDVNVTTQYPGEAAITRSSSSDSVYGTRALISKRNAACSSCGGVAYVGVFDTVGTYYQPAWVFYDALGNGHAKYVAEAISHEVGHNGGLSHDGTTSGTTYYQGHGSGETAWAPIMGVGYYNNNSQWSKGEYSDANNTQDDFVVWGQNGLITRNDDHGNSIATSSACNQQGTSFSAEGIIADRADKDFFSIYVGAGDVSINLAVAPFGPNLDAEIRVYNSTGALIAQSNPATTLAAGVVFSVAQQGTYYFSVDGVGYLTPTTGGYSDYGSLGYYQISGTANPPSGNQPPVAVAQASTTSGVAPLAVNFSGSGSYDPDGSITSYSWAFGNGQSGSGVNISHTFTSAGSYQVVLTVSDNEGVSAIDTVTINVTAAPNSPPTAQVSATPISGYAPLNVSFSSVGSSDSDGNIVSFSWSFGNGATSSSANPSYTYTQVGTFTATLTVTDNDGAIGTASKVITVDLDPNYLAPPTNLVATLFGNTVNLTWSDNANNESGYYVERGVSSGKGKNATITWTLVAALGANVTSFSDTGVPSGTYYYRVQAYRSGNIANSNEVKVPVGGGGGGGGGKGGKGPKA